METTRNDSRNGTHDSAGGGQRPERLPWLELGGAGDLVAIGGDLEPGSLLGLYRRGIFPWYEEGSPILWWSPDPRAVLDLDTVHVSRSLRRTLRQERYAVTFDRAFDEVILACGAARRDGTWITAEMRHAYAQLHRLGHAHSAEAWAGRELVGGVYGVAIGGLFAGESMFHRRPDASKVALVELCARLRQKGFALFDLQVLNDFTAGMGGVEIPRRVYLERLGAALSRAVEF